MTPPLIYHGTPMTPRAALEAVLPGRAACVSFYRPDDVEAVEAVCPQLMFRSRRVLEMAGSLADRRGVGPSRARPSSILRVVGAAAVHARPNGGRLRHPRRSFAAQRLLSRRLALWSVEGHARLAHEQPDRAAGLPAGEVGLRLPRVDRRVRPGLGSDPSGGAGGGLRRVPCSDGRGGSLPRQPMASPAHDARHTGRPRISVRSGGLVIPRTERVAL